jgi:hypothetical protein
MAIYYTIDPNVIGNAIIALNYATMLAMYNKMPINSVKSPRMLIAVDGKTADNVAGTVEHNYPALIERRNKANINFDSDGANTPVGPTLANTIRIPDTLMSDVFIENSYYSIYGVDGDGYAWHGHDGIDVQLKGYFAFWFYHRFTLNEVNSSVFKIAEGVGDTNIKLLVEMSDNNITFKIISTGGGAVTKTETLTIPQSFQYFILVSWENIIAGTTTDNVLNLKLKIIYYDYAVEQWKYATQHMEADGYYYFESGNGMSAKFYSIPYIYYALLNVTMDNYLTELHQVLALSRQYPVYQDDPIGIDYETVQAIILNDYFVNNNIRFELYSISEQDNRPGRIIWIEQTNIVSTNEFTINEDITAILPFKSVQPTNEHDALYIWAGNALKLMTFVNDIPDIQDVEQNVGITSKYLFVIIPFGCVWAAPEGIRIMQDGNTRVISKARVEVDTITAICYNSVTNSVYIISETGTSYIYCISNDAFFEIEADNLPSSLGNFSVHKGVNIHPSGSCMYNESTTDLSVDITLQDINIVKQVLLRAVDKTNLPSTITTFDAVVYNHEGDNDSIEQQTTMTTNKYYQVPGLKGTPVKITFTPTSAIEAIEVIEK